MNTKSLPPLFLSILCLSAFLLCFSHAQPFYRWFGVYGFTAKLFYFTGWLVTFGIWLQDRKALPDPTGENDQ